MDFKVVETALKKKDNVKKYKKKQAKNKNSFSLNTIATKFAILNLVYRLERKKLVTTNINDDYIFVICKC
mgnify:FL=1